MPKNGKLIDLTGQKFGRLTVIDRAENGKGWRVRWNCLCECGNKAVVRTESLRSGHTQSCNCLMKDINGTRIGNDRRTHGATIGRSDKAWQEMSRVYRAWASMKDRICRDPRYRHLAICDRWLNSYENFLADMGQAPSEKHQVDRIDNSKGYSPDNCRWVTPKENMRNTTVNRMIEWCGETKCMAEWEEKLCPVLGLKTGALRTRLFVFGWSVNKAFTTPNSIQTTQFKKRK